MSNKKKVLFVATVVKTHINMFHLPYLAMFKEQGYETFVCAKNDFPKGETCLIPGCDHFVEIPFSRDPLSVENFKAYFQLKNLIATLNFDIIHCHTPVGGAVTRLVVRSLPHKKTRVIYTAHGFHFYKGCPAVNWLCYYPIEKWLSKYTDTLITINHEDYMRAGNFKAAHVEYVNGVGLDIKKISLVTEEVLKKKMKLGIEAEDIVLLSVGELIKRKNHTTVIQAIAKLKNPHIKYLICGDGKLKEKLGQLIQRLGVEKQVSLLGFRSDMSELYKISNVFILPSLQEGLSVALMEAMACSLPVIVSNIRGNCDLIKNGEGGYLVSSKSVEEYKAAIERLIQKKELCCLMGKHNYETVQRFTLENVCKKMKKIYFDS